MVSPRNVALKYLSSTTQNFTEQSIHRNVDNGETGGQDDGVEGGIEPPIDLNRGFKSMGYSNPHIWSRVTPVIIRPVTADILHFSLLVGVDAGFGDGGGQERPGKGDHVEDDTQAEAEDGEDPLSTI